MEYSQGFYPILKKTNIAKNCYDLTILCPEIAAAARPGQFVHVKVNGFILRRPISICDIDIAAGTIRIVFEIRGEGTKVMADMNQNTLIDLIAPLGRGFTLLSPARKVIIVGGGLGVPPMLALAKEYGESATVIVGFRSADAVILTEDFQRIKSELILCTDDGTRGQKGFVTTALEKRLESSAGMLYACGPHAMLKRVAELAQEHSITCELSLEERMGCGVGACLVCACKAVKNGKEYLAHVCTDGPVFNSKEVIL